MGNNFVSNSNANSLFTKIAQRLGLRPKTWTGTQSDWDNLDPSVQAEYEYVNFTDDYAPTQIITWDDWNALTPQQQAAIPEAEIINAPGVDGALTANLLTKLWENPDPSQPFAAQNITLSSSDYEFLLTLYITNNTITAASKGVGHSVIVKKGSSISLDCVLPYGGMPAAEYYRPMIRNSDTSYSVGTCRIGGVLNSGSVSFTDDNTYACIPVAIYGIKSSINLKFSAIASDISTAADHCMMSNNTSVESNVNSLNTRVGLLEGRSNIKIGYMNINVETPVSDYGPYTYAGSNGTTGKNIYALGAIAPARNWLVLAEMYPSEDPDIQMIRVYANGTGTITVRYIYVDRT